MLGWYIVQTKPKKEDHVRKQLARASYEVFCPRMKGLHALKPLFPSYIFIRMNLEDSLSHRLIRFTRGVRRILGGEQEPQPVSDLIVETLQERTKDGALIEQEILFKEGDEVSVKRGLLKDLQGIIEKNLPDAGRVKVLFKWLRGPMRATLKYTDLEKVAA